MSHSYNKPAGRNAAWEIILAAATVAILIGVVGRVASSALAERSLGLQTSPDGSLTAEYSWRPSGPLDVFVGTSPWLYLTVREARSGMVIRREARLGDAPTLGDAELIYYDAPPW